MYAKLTACAGLTNDTYQFKVVINVIEAVS